MAETLLGILLVTSSANGSSLVYRWPPTPTLSTRLSRPRPNQLNGAFQLDNPGRAASYSETESGAELVSPVGHALDADDDYEWKRSNVIRDRSMSFSHSVPRPSSGRNSPSKDGSYDLDRLDEPSAKDAYDDLFGYSSEFLAGLLCPQRSLCHQKFELVVDEIAFIGHPVCVEEDGVWRFKREKLRAGPRGRESRNQQLSQSDGTGRDASSGVDNRPPQTSWLQKFHLVIVLDLPDPSSSASASGNVSKYFDIIYEQIAFTVTAVLFQEQVISNFVEAECEILGSLKDEYLAKGESFSDYMSNALQVSSIAPAMKVLYEAIKSSSVAHITINKLPLELQLPPYLDHLLHSVDEYELDVVENQDEERNVWGKEMRLGWRLPTLAPWKSLLLLDDHGLDPQMGLEGPHVRQEDRALAEGLIRFLQTVSVTLSCV